MLSLMVSDAARTASRCGREPPVATGSTAPGSAEICRPTPLLVAGVRSGSNVQRVNPRLRVLVVAFLLVTVATPLVLMQHVRNGDIDWSKQIARCFDRDKHPRIDTGITCLTDVYVSAARAGDMPEVIDILEREADPLGSPDNFAVCHRATHLFGPSAVSIFGGTRPAMEQLETPVCGLVHGPYDIFGREDHADAEWYELVSYCESVRARTGSRVQCADAVGHALQQGVMRGTDPGRQLWAAGICSRFTELGGRLDCHEALVMELYGPLDPTLEPREAPGDPELVDGCLRYPANLLDARAGCLSGVGWYLSEKFRYASTPVITEYVRSTCDAAGPELSGYCLRRWLSLSVPVGADQVASVGALCTSTELRGRERDCFYAMYHSLDEDERARLAEGHPEFIVDFTTNPGDYPSAPPPSRREP